MSAKKITKISVIMPAFNTAKYIKDAIDSVLVQDYGNFELLIRDDCSEDETWEIIKKYRNKTNIRIFKNKKNLGSASTRNMLIKDASGEYVSICDSDDIMLSDNLKRLAGYLDRHLQYGAVYGDILMIEEGLKINPPGMAKFEKKFGWDLLQNRVNHAGSMIRKSLMNQIRGYAPHIKTVHDWDLWLKLAEITKIKYLEKEAYYIWRRHSKSLTRSGKDIEKDCRRIITAAIDRRHGKDFDF